MFSFVVSVKLRQDGVVGLRMKGWVYLSPALSKERVTGCANY